MKFTRILAYRVELPLHETTYQWSGGKSVTVFDSAIVRVESGTGLAGHSEVCPLGPFYLPAYADGLRASRSASPTSRENPPHVRDFRRGRRAGIDRPPSLPGSFILGSSKSPLDWASVNAIRDEGVASPAKQNQNKRPCPHSRSPRRRRRLSSDARPTECRPPRRGATAHMNTLPTIPVSPPPAPTLRTTPRTRP